jgi:hypothetical protein
MTDDSWDPPSGLRKLLAAALLVESATDDRGPSVPHPRYVRGAPICCSECLCLRQGKRNRSCDAVRPVTRITPGLSGCVPMTRAAMWALRILYDNRTLAVSQRKVPDDV